MEYIVKEKFAIWLKNFRLKIKYTQEMVAEETGLSQSVISKYEQGEYGEPPALLIIWALEKGETKENLLEVLSVS